MKDITKPLQINESSNTIFYYQKNLKYMTEEHINKFLKSH